MIKPIPNFPGYEASDNGDILSYRNKYGLTKKPHRLIPIINSRGYHVVNLRINGKYKIKKVGVLILETFIGPRPIGRECCHGGNGKSDNSLNNVYWATHFQNQLDDRIRDKTLPSGEHCGLHKLNYLQVRIIRKAYNKKHGLTLKYLGEIFNVTQSNISSILHNKTWIPERLQITKFN
jgi:hypothetical protein